MDAKITKERLGLLLSYDWIKIACICIAAVAAWLLLFTSTATRPPHARAGVRAVHLSGRVADKWRPTLPSGRARGRSPSTCWK